MRRPSTRQRQVDGRAARNVADQQGDARPRSRHTAVAGAAPGRGGHGAVHARDGHHRGGPGLPGRARLDAGSPGGAVAGPIDAAHHSLRSDGSRPRPDRHGRGRRHGRVRVALRPGGRGVPGQRGPGRRHAPARVRGLGPAHRGRGAASGRLGRGRLAVAAGGLARAGPQPAHAGLRVPPRPVAGGGRHGGRVDHDLPSDLQSSPPRPASVG